MHDSGDRGSGASAVPREDMDENGRKSRVGWLLVGGGILILAVAAVAWLPRRDAVSVSVLEQPETPRGPSLWGRVVDEAGRPVEGAEVWGADGLLAVTDEKGYVQDRFTGAAGIVWITAPGRERVSRGSRGSRVSGGIGSVRLRRGGSIRGRVADRDGKPVAGARVLYCEPEQRPLDGQNSRAGVFEEGNKYSRRETTSDGTGAFSLEGCPEGDGFVVTIAQGFLAEWTGVDVVPGEEIECRVELPPDPILETPRMLHVLRPDGTPHDRVRVIARHEGDVLVPQNGASPLSLDRRFGVIAGLEVRDSQERFEPVFLDHVAVGDEPLRVELAVGSALTLRFRDAGGAVVSEGGGAAFWGSRSFGSWSVRVRFTLDTQGRATIRKPETPFRIELTAPGFGSQRLGPFDPETIGSELVVEPEASGAVRALVLREGRPVAGARVGVAFRSGGTSWFRAGGFADDPFTVNPWARSGDRLTDDGGRLLVSVPHDGNATLSVEVDGLAAQVFGPFRVSKHPPATEITVELREPGILEGRVRVREGESPAGREVLACPGWATVFRALTDAEGRYRIEGLPPGRYQVRPAPVLGKDAADRIHGGFGNDFWRAPDPRPWDCEVRAGEVTRHDLDLCAEALLSVRLAPTHTGEPELVSVYHAETFREHGSKAPAFAMLRLDAGGQASVPLSRAGRYVLLQKYSKGIAKKITAFRELAAELELEPGDNRFEWIPTTGSVLLRRPPSDAGPREKNVYHDVTLHSDQPAGATYDVNLRVVTYRETEDLLIPDLPTGVYQVTCERLTDPPTVTTRRVEVRADAAVLVDLP